MGRFKGGENKSRLSPEEKIAKRKIFTDGQRLHSRQNIMMINGKRVEVNKRPRPNTCEVCGCVPNKLDYHHWDDGQPEKGLWLCSSCHFMAEKIEKGLHDKYIRLKQEVDNGTNRIQSNQDTTT